MNTRMTPWPNKQHSHPSLPRRPNSKPLIMIGLLAGSLGLSSLASASTGGTFTPLDGVVFTGVNSNLAQGNASNETRTGDFDPTLPFTHLRLSGTLSKVAPATFANGAGVRVTNPGSGDTFIVQPSGPDAYSGTVVVTPGYTPYSGGGSGISFEFFESVVDDAGGPDQVWDTVILTAGVISTSPNGNFALGTLPGDGTSVMGPGQSGNPYHSLVTSPIVNNSGLDYFTLDLTTGVHSGSAYLNITTSDAGTGDPVDTEVFIFSASGQLVAQDDDGGAGAYSQLSFGAADPLIIDATAGEDGLMLPRGFYTVVVGGFNTEVGTTIDSLAPGFISGDYELTVSYQADPAIALLNQNPAGGDRMGYAVSIDGDYAVVGTRLDDVSGLANSGSVEIFKRDSSGNWLPHQTLLSPELSAQHHFGHAVGISGDFIVVGEEKNSTGGFRAGAAHLFKRNTATDQWAPTTSNYAGAREFAGRSVAIDGNWFIFGVLNANTSAVNTGLAVLVEFDNDGNQIDLQTALPMDVAAGDNFGNAVSISGNYAVMGAFRDDDTANGSGSAYVFYRDAGGTWSEIAKLVASDAVALDQFGYSVSIDGDTIAVGSRLADIPTGNQVGAVYVYVGVDVDGDGSGSLESWTQVQKLTASDAVAGDRLGTSVAVEGDRLLSGAPQADKDASNDRSGKAYLYTRDGVTGVWGQESQLYNEETTTRDEFGIGVALSGTHALVGSWLDNRPQNNTGAAYVFNPPYVQYAIGDTGPGGGIVFAVDGSGGGLEAAPTDQSNAPWCADLIDIPGVDNIPDVATADTHTGAENTDAIIANCPTPGHAAEVASGYVWPNGQTDGFLPNKEELNLLYLQRAVVGGFANDTYWSSSEFDVNFAWFQKFFLDGSQFVNFKNFSLRVRAVRAF